MKTKILSGLTALVCLFTVTSSMAAQLQLAPSSINGELSLSYWQKDSFWSSPIKMVSQALTFINTSKLGTMNGLYLVKFESDNKPVAMAFSSGAQYCTPYKVGQLLINKSYTDRTGNVAILMNYDKNTKLFSVACAPTE